MTVDLVNIYIVLASDKSILNTLKASARDVLGATDNSVLAAV